MKKVIIMTDSSADLSKDYCTTREVKVLPFAINIDGKEYYDGLDITTEEMFKLYEKTKSMPKTAARSVQDIKDLVLEHRTDEQDIVWVSISGQCSANANNANTALEELKQELQCDNLYYVDSKALSSGIGLLIERACNMRDEGKSGAEIQARLVELSSKVQISFMVENLHFLHKSGRCGGVAAFAGGVLKIRPTLRVIDGKISVGKKHMISGFEKVLEKYVAETLSLYPDYEDDIIYITHSFASDKIIAIVTEQIKKLGHFKNIVVAKAGPTISTHCGKGTIGLIYMCK